MPARSQPRSRNALAGRVVGALLVLLAAGAAAQAQTVPPDAKPYDDKLTRLAEILGAVHYLRELCGAEDGQYWRERMRELIDGEGASALRRARLARAFNQGYHSYSRTYVNCTGSAKTAIARFMAEGAQISDNLVKTIP
jgi:uncharacterized protein (TIGR02301 family)